MSQFHNWKGEQNPIVNSRMQTNSRFDWIADEFRRETKLLVNDSFESKTGKKARRRKSQKMKLSPVIAERNRLSVAGKPTCKDCGEMFTTDAKYAEHYEAKHRKIYVESSEQGVGEMDNAAAVPNSDFCVGENYVVLQTVLYCQLCDEMFKKMDEAERHCKSYTHYDNFMKVSMHIQANNEEVIML